MNGFDVDVRVGRGARLERSRRGDHRSSSVRADPANRKPVARDPRARSPLRDGRIGSWRVRRFRPSRGIAFTGGTPRTPHRHGVSGCAALPAPDRRGNAFVAADTSRERRRRGDVETLLDQGGADRTGRSRHRLVVGRSTPVQRVALVLPARASQAPHRWPCCSTNRSRPSTLRGHAGRDTLGQLLLDLQDATGARFCVTLPTTSARPCASAVDWCCSTPAGRQVGQGRPSRGGDRPPGVIANPDEDRMVGHYWLRAPRPRARARDRPGDPGALDRTVKRLRRPTSTRRASSRRGRSGSTDVLVIGIGGSALGPQFVADALGGPGDRHDALTSSTTPIPTASTAILSTLGSMLDRTLEVVISKSGSTPETRNGMLETQAAYERALGLDFGRHAVAVTGEGSRLDRFADEHGLLERFPMWDWVGGRTSVTVRRGAAARRAAGHRHRRAAGRRRRDGRG